MATAPQIWSTARVTSCGLFHIAYANTSVILQNELKRLYVELCRDPSNRVREAAAVKIGTFAATIEQLHTQKGWYLVFRAILFENNMFQEVPFFVLRNYKFFICESSLFSF